MQAYQTEHGDQRPEHRADRTTMAWMGMPTPLRQMPGMATPEQVEALRDAKGAEADRLFLELMTQHHLGGAHMSEFAAAEAADPKVRELAQRMATNQRIEVNEYQLALERVRGT
jgi:uncharacterized protein (DUF305 family)